MIKFTTHDENGILHQAFEVFTAEEVLDNVPDGLFAVSGWGDYRTRYAKDGELRDYPPSPGAWAVFDIDSESWTDPRSEADLAAEAAAALAARRFAWQCSRMQGILALGAERWGAVLAYRDQPTTSFGERAVIDSASIWRRNSENIAFFAWLLNLDDAEVDALFEAAVQIEA